MKPRYTVLSFNFNGYDKVREPFSVDPEAEYVFVTDRPVKTTLWKVIVDPRLTNRNPVYSSYYVRWHPFEYATTDTVMVVDASVQIKDSLADIYAEFAESGADFAPMCSVFTNDERKLKFWVDTTQRLDSDSGDRLRHFIEKMGQAEWKGSLGMSYVLFRDTAVSGRYRRHVWRYLLALGTGGVPNRLDEVVAHKLMYAYRDTMALFPLSVQVIQSSYMTYCAHNSDMPVTKYKDFEQCFYLCNCPISPNRFDKGRNFPRKYRYRTEAILLTRYLDSLDLAEWLDHHLNTVKFDHVHIFDNESNYDVKGVCDAYNEAYGERISYQKVYGHPRQYRLYDAYINSMSDAEWVMPIDDDEYLDIGDFDCVYDAIMYYKKKYAHLTVLAVRWKHLFPKKFHTERDGNVLDYCTEENPELAKSFMHLGDTTVKCIVRRYGDIHYEETWENPAGGHVPKHSCFQGALTCDGRTVTGCGILDCPDNLDDERIRLIHCRYTGPKDWERRYGGNGETTVSDSSPRKKQFPFMELLNKLD
jgi:hypothetical protein